MKKITKRIFGIVMTSAILVSGALTCFAMHSQNWLYQYKYVKHNNHIERTYDYYYINVTWPDGHTLIDDGEYDKVVSVEQDPYLGPYYYHQVTHQYHIL